MPYADNGMRYFFFDKDSHYFYLSTRQHNADAR
jgi:hypothetical protein